MKTIKNEEELLNELNDYNKNNAKVKAYIEYLKENIELIEKYIYENFGLIEKLQDRINKTIECIKKYQKYYKIHYTKDFDEVNMLKKFRSILEGANE